MKVKSALILNALSGGIGKISMVLIKLLQVPLLLNTLGVDNFGVWLVLTSLPAWLSLANIGFGSVASNEMSMAISLGDTKKANNLFSTTLALVSLIGICGSIITIIVAPLIPWEKILNVSESRHLELSMTIIWLSLSVFINFYGEAFNGRFRAARKAHLSILISSTRPWIELMALFMVLKFSSRFDYLSQALFFSNLLYLLIIQFFSWASFKEITFSFSNIQINHFKYLFKKGIAFQAFPLGNAILFQGNLLVVQFVLGSAAVALFGTARTLVRSINQVFELSNQVIWPELSHLLGLNDLSKAARLHRLGVGVTLLMSIICTTGMAFFGKFIYSLWTDKTIILPDNLLILFLLPIPFNAIWFTSSVVHVACNKHEGLAIRYLIATGISIFACVSLSYWGGIEGAALSTIITDIILIPYVIKQSLVLTGDNITDFIKGLLIEQRIIIGGFGRLLKNYKS